MYDEVIKRIDAKKIILDSLVARERKKASGNQSRLLKQGHVDKKVLLIKKGRVLEKKQGYYEFNKLSTQV
jgi:hypothetical protein